MAKISKIEEVKDYFAKAADKIVAGWIKARDEDRFHENWKKKMEQLGAKIGTTTEKRYMDGVTGVKKEDFERRVKESSDKYLRKYLRGLAK